MGSFHGCFYSLVILHVLCVCEMMRLVSVNDILSYLNLRNDKRNSSRLGRRSHKTSMVFNGGSFLRIHGKFLIILFTYQLAGISRVRITLGWS